MPRSTSVTQAQPYPKTIPPQPASADFNIILRCVEYLTAITGLGIYTEDADVVAGTFNTNLTNALTLFCTTVTSGANKFYRHKNDSNAISDFSYAAPTAFASTDKIIITPRTFDFYKGLHGMHSYVKNKYNVVINISGTMTLTASTAIDANYELAAIGIAVDQVVLANTEQLKSASTNATTRGTYIGYGINLSASGFNRYTAATAGSVATYTSTGVTYSSTVTYSLDITITGTSTTATVTSALTVNGFTYPSGFSKTYGSGIIEVHPIVVLNAPGTASLPKISYTAV